MSEDADSKIKEYFNLAIKYMDHEEFDKAILEYLKVIKLDKKNIWACNNIGNCYISMKKYDEAIVWFNKTLNLKKDNPVPYYNMGNAYSYLKRYDEAIKCYNEALKWDSTYADAHNNLGCAYFDKKMNKKAITCFHNSLSYEKDNPEVIFNLGLAYSSEKDPNNAIKYYNEALNLDKQLENYPDSEFFSSYLYLKEKIDRSKLSKIYGCFCKIISEVEDIKEDHSFSGQFTHYTKPEVIISLFDTKDYLGYNEYECKNEKSVDSKFRLYNTKYMNDPEEGQILLKVAEKIGSPLCHFYNETGKEDKFLTFIGSFLPDDDRLMLWRTYGKDSNGEEAKGLNIVFKKDFFGKSINGLHKLNTDSKNEIKSFESSNIGVDPIVAYEVIYEEGISLEEAITAENIPKKEFIPDEKFKKRKTFKLLNNIKEDLQTLHSLKNENEEEYGAVKTLLKSIIDEVRYLIKSKDYREENEYRTIISYDLKKEKEKIKLDKRTMPPKLYVEIDKDLKKYIEKVKIGPRVENPEYWQVYLKYHGIDSEVSTCKFK
ncbi:tetratricopeptide repeat protein [Methanococcus maripaludis]|uniref:Tetratricopeptide (TPR) repeat protein n=1 Tax=Methanococcus maripaludis TaxID=39152 RepID=A0A7J9S2J5_METMI|nr:tetratricopeptide repeat protein [Methanococcus maripaludis]MBB6067920.1 tetratricopeptide (TPR) repeat protein [Methanococcus maripaludis]